MRAELTKKQHKLLQVLRELKSRSGFPPSIREVAAALGVSAPTALERLRTLERKGKIRRTPGRARSFELTHLEGHPPAELIQVPILGSVPAGQPFLAEEHFDGALTVDQRFAGTGPLFALKVSGDSMVGAGIHSGDYIVAQAQERARNGDIVVARIGGDVTVKRLSVQRRRMFLVPENSSYPKIPFGGEDAAIQGKVVSVIGRRL